MNPPSTYGRKETTELTVEAIDGGMDDGFNEEIVNHRVAIARIEDII